MALSGINPTASAADSSPKLPCSAMAIASSRLTVLTPGAGPTGAQVGKENKYLTLLTVTLAQGLPAGDYQLELAGEHLWLVRPDAAENPLPA